MPFKDLISQPNDITEFYFKKIYKYQGIFIACGYKRVTFLCPMECNHYCNYYVEKGKISSS